MELKSNLIRAIKHMKQRVHGKRSNLQLNEGDSMWVKLKKYRQGSMVAYKSNKLERRYFGPFQVVEHIGEVA